MNARRTIIDIYKSVSKIDSKGYLKENWEEWLTAYRVVLSTIFDKNKLLAAIYKEELPIATQNR